jgi:hypothetical protein
MERLKFIRLDYVVPLAYKVCKKVTISKLLKGYTSNVSQAGVLCNIKDKVHKNDILWLSFDRTTLNICEDLDRRTLIYQNGIVGKVVRIEPKNDGTYDIGIQFITREEKNLTNIYPKIYFLQKQDKGLPEEVEEEEEEGQPEEKTEENKEQEVDQEKLGGKRRGRARGRRILTF